MLPKDYSSKYLRIDPTKDRDDFAIDIQVYEKPG